MSMTDSGDGPGWTCGAYTIQTVHWGRPMVAHYGSSKKKDYGGRSDISTMDQKDGGGSGGDDG